MEWETFYLLLHESLEAKRKWDKAFAVKYHSHPEEVFNVLPWNE